MRLKALFLLQGLLITTLSFESENAGAVGAIGESCRARPEGGEDQYYCNEGLRCGFSPWSVNGVCMCTSPSQCSDGLFCNGEEVCAGATPHLQTDPTGCFPGTPPCSDGQRCNEQEKSCEVVCDTDRDGDGFLSRICGGDDCNDNDPGMYPGNLEVCDRNNKDEDCDPLTFGERDADGDGHVDAMCQNFAAPPS